jgi:hypothetical protein
LLPGPARLEAHAIALEALLEIEIEPCGHRTMVSLVARLIPATSAGAAGPLLVIKPPANGVDL